MDWHIYVKPASSTSSSIYSEQNLLMKRKINSFPSREDLSILFIVPSDYTSLLAKGVVSMILERDEGGFFKRVFNVHPYASKTQTMDLNGKHQLIEFGPDYPFRFLNFRGGGLINYFLKPAFVLKTLLRLLKEEHIDVIRATDPYWCGFYAWASSKLTDIPFCISVHADYDKCYTLEGRKGGTPVLFKIFEKFLLPRAKLVMPIREYLVPKILKRGVTPDRIRVIPHGVAIEDFSNPKMVDICKTFGVPSGKKVLSFVGRLAKENYLYDIVALAKRLSKIRDDFVVLLVGGGPEHEELKALVQESNLASFVIFTGFQPREKVILIRRQSVMALCLMGGFSLIEASAASVPIIAYDVEWHSELVKNGKTGFLIKEGDLEGLVKAVVHLLDHPEEAREMGANARELAVARHHLSYTSEVKKNCYRELLQSTFG